MLRIKTSITQFIYFDNLNKRDTIGYIQSIIFPNELSYYNKEEILLRLNFHNNLRPNALTVNLKINHFDLNCLDTIVKNRMIDQLIKLDNLLLNNKVEREYGLAYKNVFDDFHVVSPEISFFQYYKNNYIIIVWFYLEEISRIPLQAYIHGIWLVELSPEFAKKIEELKQNGTANIN